MTLKILDELERLQVYVDDKTRPNRIHIHPVHVETIQALPVLIRVARAAERLSKTDDCFRMLFDVEMKEALQELRESGGT